MRAYMTRITLVVLLVFLLLGAKSDPRARFNDLGHHLMCTCGCGQVLLECNHVGCTSSDKMRAELQQAIDSGNDDDQVLAGFVEKYGNVVLAAPTMKGFDRVAWIMPYLALLLGIALCVWVVRKWRSRIRPAAEATVAVEPAEIDSLRRRVHEETEI